MIIKIDPGSLGLARCTGRKLPVAVRRRMEAVFDADFSAVRVHIGPQAERLGTIAFAAGTDIYFAPGFYDPMSDPGEFLLCHELAHVVQQSRRTAGRRRDRERVVLVQDRQLEAEADHMANRARLRQPLQSPRAEWPAAVRGLSRNTLIIQCWTPSPEPMAHHVNCLSQTSHKKYEVLTNKAGVESDTGNFVHHAGSPWLDSCTDALKCYYNGTEIGRLRTVTEGSERVKPLVKMHLVNSYLHPSANNWTDNWIWGSHDLNKQHNTHEELAKLQHPENNKNNLFLQYETSAVEAKRPTASTLVNFTAQLTEKISTMRNAAGMSNFPVNYSEPDPDLIRIGEGALTVAQFFGLWETAIRETAYARIHIKFRFYTKSNSWAGDYDKSAEYDDTYLIDIIEGSSKKRQVGSIWSQLFPYTDSRKRTKYSKR